MGFSEAVETGALLLVAFAPILREILREIEKLAVLITRHPPGRGEGSRIHRDWESCPSYLHLAKASFHGWWVPLFWRYHERAFQERLLVSGFTLE